MRLFVSVDLADALTEEVRALQDDLGDASGLNLTDPSQVHVTLKFLGETGAEQLEAVESAIEDGVAAADVGPFDATFRGLGAFPSEEYIRVVWVGVEDGAAELTRLHEEIEERTVALGFDPEEHDFTPHATVARMEHAGGKELVQQMLRERDPVIGEMRVEEVRLKESELRPEGPEYSTAARFPL